MTAREWANRFNSSPANQLPTEYASFIQEIGEIARKRGGSLNAIEGAIREQRTKFQAVCSLTDRVRPIMFESMLVQYGQDFLQAKLAYEKMVEAKANAKSKKRRGRKVA